MITFLFKALERGAKQGRFLATTSEAVGVGFTFRNEDLLPTRATKKKDAKTEIGSHYKRNITHYTSKCKQEPLYYLKWKTINHRHEEGTLHFSWIEFPQMIQPNQRSALSEYFL